MTLKQDTTIVKNCNTSAQMFNVRSHTHTKFLILRIVSKTLSMTTTGTLSRAVSSRLQ